MSPPPENFYADWRPRLGAGNVLRDENDPPPERLLQAIWHHQRLTGRDRDLIVLGLDRDKAKFWILPVRSLPREERPLPPFIANRNR